MLNVYMQFLSDLTHIVNAYKADRNLRGNDRLVCELSEAQAGRLEAEKRASEVEGREKEAIKKGSEENAKLGEENQKLIQKVASMGEEMAQMKVTVEAEKKRYSDLEAECGRGREEIVQLWEENIVVKAEVERGVTDVANALGVGYGYCYDRLAAAGVDLTGHSFDDYCSDLAKKMPKVATGEKSDVA